MDKAMDRFECPNCGWPMEEEADECTDCAIGPNSLLGCETIPPILRT